jgi:hypothetical protein
VTTHGVIFEIFTKLAYIENSHKVFLYSKTIIIYFSLFASQTGLQMLQHSLLFSHEKYYQSRLVSLLNSRISKQASWRQQQRQFQKPFLKPVSLGKKMLKKQKLGLLSFLAYFNFYINKNA